MTDPAEIEALARAMCVELGEDADEDFNPVAGLNWPRWRYHEIFAKRHLAARLAEAKAEPGAQGMTDDEIAKSVRRGMMPYDGSFSAVIDDAIDKAIRLTRANTRPAKLTAEQVEAIEDAALTAYALAHAKNYKGPLPQVVAIREALRLAGVTP
jgi:hypothetical protein